MSIRTQVLLEQAQRPQDFIALGPGPRGTGCHLHRSARGAGSRQCGTGRRSAARQPPRVQLHDVIRRRCRVVGLGRRCQRTAGKSGRWGGPTASRRSHCCSSQVYSASELIPCFRFGHSGCLKVLLFVLCLSFLLCRVGFSRKVLNFIRKVIT